MDYSNLFVCLMGMGTVFIGLICLIILVSVMSAVVRKTDKVMEAHAAGTNASSAPALPAAVADRSAQSTGNASEVTPGLIAAISAVIAEEMGTDVSAIRIRSLKKVQ